MHEYRTARSIFGFMEFGAWACVVLGVITALVGMAGGGRMLGGGGGILAALPGLLIVFIGIFAVMMVQIGRATVDTAEMTGKLLKNSNEELQILKSADRTVGFSGETPAQSLNRQSASFGDLDVSSPSSEAAEEAQIDTDHLKEVTPGIYEFKGRQLFASTKGIMVGNEAFATIEDAKQFISNDDGQLAIDDRK